MKKSRRIVKKMSKKSLINKKALRYIIANSNLCKHAIRELELAGYSKEEDGPNKWMREQVIEAVALFSSHGNSGFSAPFEINLVKKLCSFDIISPLRFDDGEWEVARIKENHRYSKSRTGVSMMLMHFQKFL